VAVLIDVQNLYHSARNLYQARVNFSEVIKPQSGSVSLSAHLLTLCGQNRRRKAVFDALTKLGIETRIRDLQEFYDGMKKADWDVGITVDAIRISPSVDTIVLASGDGDFLQLVDYLKNQGKRVEVIAFDRSASAKLKEAADAFIDIEKDPQRFLLKK